MTYALLRNIEAEFHGDAQMQIDQLENLQRSIQAELTIVGSTGGAVVFRCNICGLPVHPQLAHRTGLAILCPYCAAKLLAVE